MGFQPILIYGETKETIAIKLGRLPEWVYPALIHGKKDINIINTISNIDKYEDERKIRYNLILPTYSTIYAKGICVPDNNNIIRLEMQDEETFKEIFKLIEYITNGDYFKFDHKEYRHYGTDKPYRYFNYPSNTFTFEIDTYICNCLWSTTNIICGTFFKTGFDYGNNFIDFIIKGSYDYYNCNKYVDLKIYLNAEINLNSSVDLNPQRIFIFKYNYNNIL